MLQLQRFRCNRQPSERISLSLCVLRLILLSAPKELTKHPCIRAPNHPAYSHKHPILDSTRLSFIFLVFFSSLRLTKSGREIKKKKKEKRKEGLLETPNRFFNFSHYRNTMKSLKVSKQEPKSLRKRLFFGGGGLLQEDKTTI